MNSGPSRTMWHPLLVGLCLVTACSTTNLRTHTRKQQTGESVVLVGTDPARMAFLPELTGAVEVRSTYLKTATNTIIYEPGQDYAVDLARGEIRRTYNSRIPDFRTNVLYGVKDFDHSKFPGFGNSKFFVYVDYTSQEKADWPIQPSQPELLPRSRQKLEQGEPFKIVAFGDSITAGGDATQPSLIYWQRWADALEKKYPKAAIESINGATGGDTTRNGLDRLSDKVISQKPDLVLIAFGMNDHNVGGYGTPIEAFTQNLETMIGRVRKETIAEIIILSTFPPNPNWRFGSHKMELYALATEKVARENQCAYADVYRNWQPLASRKKPEDLLGNNINHPNDFGHWMYYAVLQQIGL